MKKPLTVLAIAVALAAFGNKAMMENEINKSVAAKLAEADSPAFLKGAKAEASVPLMGAFLNAYTVPVTMSRKDGKLLGVVNLDITGYCLIESCSYQLDMASAMRLALQSAFANDKSGTSK
jgi:hypothetical protein